MPNLPSEVGFCSLLSYATRPETEDEKKSKQVSVQLKQDKSVGNPARPISQWIALRVQEHQDCAAFAGLFGENVLAIPIPSSSLKQPGSLQMPLELANSLKEAGLVGEVAPIAERTRALPKSAFSQASARSKAADHYDSVKVTRTLTGATSILLVDDVITRGATLLGICARVMEAYPGLPIFGFAAMRAVSPPDKFERIFDPQRGKVTLRGDQTYRTP